MGEVKEYIHLFETENEYTTARNDNYLEPWVSYTEENTKVNYNMTEEERKQKLYGTPLTFEILTDGNIVWKTSNTASTKTIEYSKDNGVTWTSITSATGGTPIQVVKGDTVQFRGDNITYGTSSYNSRFDHSTSQFNVKGNIMSLIDSTNFSGLTTLESAYTFSYLFYGCTGLTDASKLILPATTLAAVCYYNMFQGCTSLTTTPELPATTLAQRCYDGMFYGCTSLTTAPELPATTLAEKCYNDMFRGCTSLTTAPSILPATTLATNCYASMFRSCTSLTSAPELPATTLAENCYNTMFFGCTSLTTAPELPVTTLVRYCYYFMFWGCTSLTTAPALPATTLAESCYSSMFEGCTNLNYIKCLATDISATDCTSNWVSGVASSGTFVKNPSMASWTTGTSGIPTGWTTQNDNNTPVLG